MTTSGEFSWRRVGIVALCVVMAMGSCSLILLRYTANMDRSPVPEALLEKLEVGMPREAVREILGPPTGVSPAGTWVYGDRGRWVQVLVYFDDSGKLTRYILDK